MRITFARSLAHVSRVENVLPGIRGLHKRYDCKTNHMSFETNRVIFTTNHMLMKTNHVIFKRMCCVSRLHRVVSMLCSGLLAGVGYPRG